MVKKTKDQSRGQSRASHALYESFRPMDLMSGNVSEEDLDEEALERKLALERLHAEERGRANQLILQKIEVPEEEHHHHRSESISRNESTGEPSEAKVDAFLGKENQMRSPDLEFHLKNLIFDLDRLETLNQIIFEAKVEETNKI